MAQRIFATFELVTPAFAHGADNTNRPELRVESIIGLLRRWWWAQAPLNPRFVKNDAFDSNGAAAFADNLFGFVGENGRGASQGSFLVALESNDCEAVAIDASGLGQAQRHQLVGLLGNRNKRNWLWRSQERAGHPTFSVSFTLRPRRTASGFGDDDLVSELVHSIILWGSLGGIGAGQRRGFGSVALTELYYVARDAKEPLRRPASAEAFRGWRYPFTFERGSPSTDNGGDSGSHGSLLAQACRARSSSKGGDGTLRDIFISDSVRFGDPFQVLSSVAATADGVAQNLLDRKKRTTKDNKETWEGASDIFSDQFPGNERHPSPYGLHVTTLSGSYVLVLTVVQSGNLDLLNQRVFGPSGADLRSKLGLKSIIPEKASR